VVNFLSCQNSFNADEQDGAKMTPHPNSAKASRPPPNNPKKRKEPPAGSKSATNPHPSKKSKPTDHRGRQRDARSLATQTSSKAFANGALDVDHFVKAREYEIRALEEGMQRSRKALNRRAFQQVPKDLRRRGAAHDVGKVPKQLRARAGREVSWGRAGRDGRSGALMWTCADG